MEVVRWSREEVDCAIEAMDGLQRVLAPWLRRNNFDGRGVIDSVESTKHLMMAKHALIMVGDFVCVSDREAPETASSVTKDAVSRALTGLAGLRDVLLPAVSKAGGPHTAEVTASIREILTVSEYACLQLLKGEGAL